METILPSSHISPQPGCLWLHNQLSLPHLPQIGTRKVMDCQCLNFDLEALRTCSLRTLENLLAQDITIYCDIPETIGITPTNFSIDAYEFTS